MKEFGGKSLLFVGGGEESYPGIQHAQDLGLKTAVLDRSQESPGALFADRRLVGSIFDIPRAVHLAKRLNDEWPIHGVISVATDAPSTVTAVAETLGLHSNGKSSADLISDKFRMKQRLIDFGVPTSLGFPVSAAWDIEKATQALGNRLVVKPNDSRGSRGVSFFRSGEDCESRFRDALEASPSASVLVEEFLDGPQFSTESVIDDGRIVTVGTSTRNYGRLSETYPFPIEDGGELPAQLGPQLTREFDSVLMAAASALGIESGTIKGDLVVHRGRVHVIEIAGRLSGGYFATHEIPLSTGIDYLAGAFRIALGMETKWELLVPTKSQAVAQRYFFPKPGVVREVKVPKWINAHPAVKFFKMRAQVGDTIPQIRSHPMRAGLVITTSESLESAVQLAESVVRAVHIETVVE